LAFLALVCTGDLVSAFFAETLGEEPMIEVGRASGGKERCEVNSRGLHRMTMF
jgi:hypothetical protein